MQTTKATKATNAPKATEAKASKATEAKAAKAPATDAATETTLAERIAEQRATAKAVYMQLSSAVSVPVKPFDAFRKTYKTDVSAHAIGRKPSPRQAAALAVALAASGKKLANGVTFPRKFEMRGNIYAIENGALSDALASGLAKYDAKRETVTIPNAAELSSQLGAALGKFKL